MEKACANAANVSCRLTPARSLWNLGIQFCIAVEDPDNWKFALISVNCKSGIEELMVPFAQCHNAGDFYVWFFCSL